MKKKRENAILMKLIRDGSCTIRQLALLCDVSYKTIQNDIKDINRKLGQNGFACKIVTQSGVGVVLGNAGDECLDEVCALFQDKGEAREEYDKEYESLRIAFRLLLEDYVKMDDICEKLALSRTVTAELLNQSKQLLKAYGIQVASKPYYGLYDKGTESSIRIFLFEHLIRRSGKDVACLLGDSQINPALMEGVVVLIRNHNVSVTDEILEQLLCYVEIMAIRIRKQAHIEAGLVERDVTSFESILSEKIAVTVSYELDTRIEEPEVDWIYRFVVGKLQNKASQDEETDSAVLESVFHAILELCQEKYGYDFSQDIDFYSSLSIHLNALFKRARNNNYSINPMIDEMKTYSLLAYDIAFDLSLLINDRLGVCLPDDEISYLAIYLHLAIERKKRNIVPKRLLVVCPTGRGMSELIGYHIKKQFGEYISELKTCGYYELDHVDYSQYDYLFTLKPLERTVPLPVIEFALDESSIKSAKRKVLGKHDKLPLLCMTPQELFFPDIKAADKPDALRQIIERVGKAVKLKESFYESVMEREKIVATELPNGFAFPHPLGTDMAECSFFSISVLSNPIRWKHRKIQIVLLTYVKGKVTSDLEQFYESFATLVSNKEYAVSLIENPTYEKLVEVAREISRLIH